MKFEIAKLSKVLVRVDAVVSAIEQYQSTEEQPTYIGLLTKLGLTPRDVEQMRKSTDRKVQSAVRMLELYKQHLEAEMEKRLIYQKDLPKFYNHSSLQFALKKSNPLRYGDKVLAVNTTNKSGNVDLDSLENESGITISQEVKS